MAKVMERLAKGEVVDELGPSGKMLEGLMMEARKRRHEKKLTLPVL